jgi:hypothetical protein
MDSNNAAIFLGVNLDIGLPGPFKTFLSISVDMIDGLELKSPFTHIVSHEEVIAVGSFMITSLF